MTIPWTKEAMARMRAQAAANIAAGKWPTPVEEADTQATPPDDAADNWLNLMDALDRESPYTGADEPDQ